MKIEREIVAILEPLCSIGGLLEMLEEMQLIPYADPSIIPQEITSFVDDAAELLTQIRALVESFPEQENPGAAEALEALNLGKQLFQLVKSVDQLASPATLDEMSSPYDDPEFWQAVATQTAGYLLYRWVRTSYPISFEIMDSLSFWKTDEFGLDLVRVVQTVSDPLTALTDLVLYDGEVDLEPVLAVMHTIVFLLGLAKPQRSVRFVSGQNVEMNENEAPDSETLVLSLIPPGTDLDGSVDVAVGFDGDAVNVDFAIDGQASFEYGPTDGWLLETSLTGGEQLRFSFAPASGIEVAPGTPLTSGSISVTGTPEEPWRLLGIGNGPSLSLSSLGLSAEAALTGSAAELEIGAEFTGLKLSIAPADGDSFVSEALSLDELAVEFDAAVSWSSTSGLAITGEGALEFLIPINQSIGPIHLVDLLVRIGAGTDGIEAVLATSASVDIGVLNVVVREIGLRGNLTPSNNGRGALGDLDFAIGFKPPTGLGLTINAAGIVTGGGYIEHDEAKSQYAGVAEIKFASQLELSAIGILTTQMPDGSDGWSLFLSLFSEFPALPIGFGFTLNGVGGLIGINRTLDDDVLRDRLMQGAMDSIMFPEDPVANAPAILSDIESVFPPARGQFLFGAMMKFGWGPKAKVPSSSGASDAAKQLLEIDLGVMVELPDPIRIVLLGQLVVMIPPKADAPAQSGQDLTLVELNMDVLGIVDLTAGTFALDGAIRDSHIAQILTLSGEMAVRAEFLDRPVVLISMGGFNDRFNPPASFPPLDRMRASLPVGPLAAVDVSAYMALTSNTFQMGGRIDVWAKFAGFTAEGHLGLDALIQIKPFGFIVDVKFGVSVRAGSITLMGVDVNASISGPGRWEIVGYASFKILKIKKKINLNISVGSKRNEVADSYEVLPLIVEALSDPNNWSVVENDELSQLIKVRERTDVESEAVHPFGRVQVLQSVAPLNADIEKFGDGNVDGPTLFEIDDILIGDEWRAPVEGDFVQDWFAPAHFFKMKDEEKVKAPSFEMMDGGVQLGSDSTVAGSSTNLDVKYEEIYVDPELNERHRLASQPALNEPLLDKFSRFAGAELKRNQIPQLRTSKPQPQFEVVTPAYSLLDITDNSSETPSGKSTFAQMQRQAKQANAASLSSLAKYHVKTAD